MSLVPTFLWAQDSKSIFLTIDLVAADVADMKINISETSFAFSGVVGDKKYSLTFDFMKKINASNYKRGTTRLIEFYIEKDAETEGFWDHVVKNPKQFSKSQCKTDFDKWVDEEDEADQAALAQHAKDMEMQQMMQSMGGMGGMGGMPGMGGDEGAGGFDMSKLQEMMKAQGGMGMPEGDDVAEADSDDEEMPELEAE